MWLFRRFQFLLRVMAEPRVLQKLYQGVAFAPRLLVHLASVAAVAGLAVGCVPATRYEEAKSAGDVQLAARQHAELELADTRQKLSRALAELQERDRKIADGEESISQSKFDNSMAVKQRDEATGLVDQLRGELARVGDDLRSFAQQKAELERTLAAAEARKLELERVETLAAALAILTRDLTSALGDRVTSGDVALDVRGGQLVLAAPAPLFYKDDGSLRSDSDGILSAVARVLTLHAEQSLLVATPAEAQATSLSAALSGRGVAPSRIQHVPDAHAPTDRVELTFDAR